MSIEKDDLLLDFYDLSYEKFLIKQKIPYVHSIKEWRETQVILKEFSNILKKAIEDDQYSCEIKVLYKENNLFAWTAFSKFIKKAGYDIKMVALAPKIIDQERYYVYSISWLEEVKEDRINEQNNV